MKGYFSKWKNILNISIGLVYIGFTLWLIFHTSTYVPEGQQDFWFRVFISYGILNAVIFGSADMRNKLFNVKLTKFLPRFFMWLVIGLVVFFVIMKIADPLEHSFFELLRGVPLWLGLIHAFVFATTESVIWQGYLDDKIGHPWSELTAGIFHFGIWTGGAIIVILGAGLLFALFSFVNWRFRQDKNDLSPAIGTHTAYNIIKLGIIGLAGGLAV